MLLSRKQCVDLLKDFPEFAGCSTDVQVLPTYGKICPSVCVDVVSVLMELSNRNDQTPPGTQDQRWREWLMTNTSTRLYNVLRSRNVLSAEAILAMEEQELARTRNAGESTVVEFRNLKARIRQDLGRGV